MRLLQGDTLGIIAILLIFAGFLFLLSHLSFLPIPLKIVGFVWFTVWLLKEIGIILVGA
ncbi:hypothetical protein J7J39_01330 [bacterium]|nr:hypothetical protein [bacterium]